VKLHLELLLNGRRLDVWRAFDNPENLRKWQPNLQSIRHVQGKPGYAGAVSVLIFDEGGRRVVLEETVLERRAPQLYAVAYHSSNNTNKVTHNFDAEGSSQTRWVVDSEYKFHGFWRFFSPLLRRTLQSRAVAEMERFKQFVEAGKL